MSDQGGKQWEEDGERPYGSGGSLLSAPGDGKKQISPVRGAGHSDTHLLSPPERERKKN